MKSRREISLLIKWIDCSSSSSSTLSACSLARDVRKRERESKSKKKLRIYRESQSRPEDIYLSLLSLSPSLPLSFSLHSRDSFGSTASIFRSSENRFRSALFVNSHISEAWKSLAAFPKDHFRGFPALIYDLEFFKYDIFTYIVFIKLTIIYIIKISRLRAMGKCFFLPAIGIGLAQGKDDGYRRTCISLELSLNIRP